MGRRKGNVFNSIVIIWEKNGSNGISNGTYIKSSKPAYPIPKWNENCDHELENEKRLYMEKVNTKE